MSPGLLLAVAVAGGLGSALRFVIDTTLTRRCPVDFPVGTNLINATGSLLLGLMVGLLGGGLLDPLVGLVIGTGLIGGYTTFSTASFETVQLVLAGRRTAALLNGVVLLVVNTGLAGVGLVGGWAVAALG